MVKDEIARLSLSTKSGLTSVSSSWGCPYNSKDVWDDTIWRDVAVILEKVSLSRSEGLEIRIIPTNILITTSDSESGVLLLGWLIFCESRHDEIAGMQIEKSNAKVEERRRTVVPYYQMHAPHIEDTLFHRRRDYAEVVTDSS
jgi:hypothetical protein